MQIRHIFIYRHISCFHVNYVFRWFINITATSYIFNGNAAMLDSYCKNKMVSIWWLTVYFNCTFYQRKLERASKSSKSRVQTSVSKGDPLDVEVTWWKETKAFLAPNQIINQWRNFLINPKWLYTLAASHTLKLEVFIRGKEMFQLKNVNKWLLVVWVVKGHLQTKINDSKDALCTHTLAVFFMWAIQSVVKLEKTKLSILSHLMSKKAETIS